MNKSCEHAIPVYADRYGTSSDGIACSLSGARCQLHDCPIPDESDIEETLNG